MDTIQELERLLGDGKPLPKLSTEKLVGGVLVRRQEEEYRQAEQDYIKKHRKAYKKSDFAQAMLQQFSDRNNTTERAQEIIRYLNDLQSDVSSKISGGIT